MNISMLRLAKKFTLALAVVALLHVVIQSFDAQRHYAYARNTIQQSRYIFAVKGNFIHHVWQHRRHFSQSIQRNRTISDTAYRIKRRFQQPRSTEVLHLHY